MLAGILLACMLAAVLPVNQLVAMAASARITFSDPAGTVGQEVSVNLKVDSGDGSLGRAEIMMAYDATVLEFIADGSSVEGGAGALRAHGGPDGGNLSSIAFTMKFRVLRPVTTQITITSAEVYDTDSRAVTIDHQGSSTITVDAAEGAAEGLLTALAVSPGTLTPEFSPVIDTYSIHVGLDVETIDVQAQAGDGSIVAVEGSEGLQMGENTITIKVTAPDGVTVKNYTISAIKSEGGETAAVQPETIEGVNLEAAAKSITILPPEEGVDMPGVFTKTTINIYGVEVTGWIWASESEHQYCVFYAMNAAGEKNFYRYDLTEKTIQRYFNDPSAESGYTKEETDTFIQNYHDLMEDYNERLYIIIALIAVSVLLLIFVIVLLVTRNSGKSSDNVKGTKGTRSRSVPEEDDMDELLDLPELEERAGERPARKPSVPKSQPDTVEGKREDDDFEVIYDEPDGEPDSHFAAYQAAASRQNPADEAVFQGQQVGSQKVGLDESEEELDDDFEMIDIDQ